MPSFVRQTKSVAAEYHLTGMVSSSTPMEDRCPSKMKGMDSIVTEGHSKSASIEGGGGDIQLEYIIVRFLMLMV